MADINKKLLTTPDGTPGPQHKQKGEDDFEFTEGSNGAQHVKIVDSAGNAISKINVKDNDVKTELDIIKQTQNEILKRLDGTFDTQVTGSNVEDENAIPTRKKSVDSEKLSEFIVLAGTEKICFSDYSPDIDEILFGCFAKNGHDYTLRTIEKPMAYDGSLYNETLIYSEGSREAVIERKFVNFHRITFRLRNRDTEDQEYRVAFRQLWRR